MNKREMKYQESLKQKYMRRAFTTAHDIARYRGIEEPVALIFQTEDGGYEIYVSSDWDKEHGPNPTDIVNDYVKQVE